MQTIEEIIALLVSTMLLILVPIIILLLVFNYLEYLFKYKIPKETEKINWEQYREISNLEKQMLIGIILYLIILIGLMIKEIVRL